MFLLDAIVVMTEKHVCDECGNSYDSSRGLAVHKGQSHTPEHQKESVLRELYQDRNLSIVEVADELDCGRSQIQKWLDRHDIDSRQAPQDPTLPPHHGFYKRGDRSLPFEYEEVQCRMNGTLYTVSVHRLIAVAHGKLHPSDMWNYDYDVHHKSGHGLDNRPDNLEAITRKEHKIRHSK